MARELGGGVPRTSGYTPRDRGGDAPIPAGCLSSQVSQGGSPGCTAPGFGDLCLPRPLPRRVAEPGREPVSHPPGPSNSPSPPAWRVPLPPRSQTLPPAPGLGSRRPRLRDGPAADQLGWGRPRPRGPGQTPRGQPHLSLLVRHTRRRKRRRGGPVREQPEPAGWGREGDWSHKAGHSAARQRTLHLPAHPVTLGAPGAPRSTQHRLQGGPSRFHVLALTFLQLLRVRRNLPPACPGRDDPHLNPRRRPSTLRHPRSCPGNPDELPERA